MRVGNLEIAERWMSQVLLAVHQQGEELQALAQTADTSPRAG